MLTITSEGDRLLRFREFNRNLDRAAIVTSTVSLGDDRAEDEARVGGHVTMRELGTHAEEERKKKKSTLSFSYHALLCQPGMPRFYIGLLD